MWGVSTRVLGAGAQGSTLPSQGDRGRPRQGPTQPAPCSTVTAPTPRNPRPRLPDLASWLRGGTGHRVLQFCPRRTAGRDRAGLGAQELPAPRYTFGKGDKAKPSKGEWDGALLPSARALGPWAGPALASGT